MCVKSADKRCSFNVIFEDFICNKNKNKKRPMPFSTWGTYRCEIKTHLLQSCESAASSNKAHP